MKQSTALHRLSCSCFARHQEEHFSGECQVSRFNK